jgi:hypothetical protein
MPRFVILRHEPPPGSARPLHWDFMVEQGETLRTWALAEEPTPDRDIAAEPLADHRLAYLEYEGPISGNRGHVTQWDRGECSIEESTPGRFVIAAFGRKLIGRIEVTLAAESETAAWRWTR